MGPCSTSGAGQKGTGCRIRPPRTGPGLPVERPFSALGSSLQRRAGQGSGSGPAGRFFLGWRVEEGKSSRGRPELFGGSVPASSGVASVSEPRQRQRCVHLEGTTAACLAPSSRHPPPPPLSLPIGHF